MSIDLLGLLAEIRDNPGETPRMILADWLEDQPDPVQRAHGQFIHLQCRLARLGKDDPERAALDETTGRLLEEHRAAWLEGLPPKKCGFDRGLVQLTIEPSSLAMLPVWEKMPAWRWVVSLRVKDVSADTARELAKWPGLARIGGVDLNGSYAYRPETPTNRIAWVRPLARSAFAAGLRSLRIASLPLGDEGVAEVAGSPHLRELVRLDLPSNLILAKGVNTLVGSPWPRLRHLGLADNLLRGDGVAVLADAPSLANLQSLDLGRNIIGPAGARALAGARHLEALTDLDLRVNGVMCEGARALAGSPLGKRLRRLNLVSNGIVEEEVRALLQRLCEDVEC